MSVDKGEKPMTATTPTRVRVFAVAFSDADKFSGYSTAYFAEHAAARAFRAEHRAKGEHALLSIEYLPAALAATVLVNR
jgi:hypothetical protein